MKNNHKPMQHAEREASYYLPDDSTAWLWRCNSQLFYTFSNNNCKRLLQLPPEALIDKPVAAVISGLAAANDAASLLNKMAKRQVISAQTMTYQLPPATVKTTLLTAIPMFGCEGEFDGYVCVESDQTQSTVANEQLRISFTSFRELFENAPVPICVLDDKDKIVSANHAVAGLFEVPLDDLQGQLLEDFELPIKTHLQEKSGLVKHPQKSTTLAQNFRVKRKSNDYVDTVIHFSAFSFAGKAAKMALFQDVTRQKETERALRYSEANYRNLFDHSLTGVGIVQNGKLTICNDRFAEIYGYPDAATICGKDFHHLISPHELFLQSDDTKEPKNQKNPIENSIRTIVDNNGHHKTIEVLSQPTEYGGLEGYQVHIVDITDRKMVEENLARSEQRYRQLFNSLPYGGEILSRKGYIMDCSPSTAAVLGYASTELIGRHISDFVLAEDLPSLNSDFKQLEEGFATHRELRMLNKTGKVVELLRASQPILDQKTGTLASIIAVSVDITERNKTLREHQQLATVVQQSGEGIAIAGPNRKIEYVNPAFCRLLDYNDLEIEQLDLLFAADKVAYAEKLHTLEKALANRLDWIGVLPMKTKNGRQIFVHCNLFSMHNGDTAKSNFVLLANDVTDEEKRQEQIQRGQKLEAIGTLSAGIAHDFNNLLTVIKGRTEMLLHAERENKKLHENLRTILTAGERAEQLINHLLAFSQQQRHNVIKVEINELLRKSVTLMRRLIPANICMESDLAEMLPPIYFDPVQFEQVIMNLVINARDAIEEAEHPKQEGRIVFSTRYEAEKNNRSAWVVLKVTDNGIGIPENMRVRVFDPYFTTKETGKGSGLGLSLIYGIIEQNGGHIYVDAAPNGGAEFTIKFPVSQRANKEFPGENQLPLQKITGKVLVVESNPDVSAFTSETLAKMALEVATAMHGKAAQKQLEEAGDFTLLITDVIMSGRSGPELARIAKEKNKEAQVIFTANYAYSDLKGIADVNAENFLRKPYSAKDLHDKVITVLGTEN
jgi:two-component system cell cycle sensor histidine kinase/response regulator CckA